MTHDFVGLPWRSLVDVKMSHLLSHVRNSLAVFVQTVGSKFDNGRDFVPSSSQTLWLNGIEYVPMRLEGQVGVAGRTNV